MILAPSLLLFVIMYLFSFIVVFSFSDWFMVWLGLEMNMMSFLSLGYHHDDSGEVESLFKYFFVQSVASGLFLFMMYVGGSVVVALALKIGGGPFYFWFPSVMKGLSWGVCFVLMTLQKFIPLVLMSGVWGLIGWGVGLFSLVIGVVGSFSQTGLRELMAFSSIQHSGWMILGQGVNDFSWVLYFFFYLIVSGCVVLGFMIKGMSKIEDLSNDKSKIVILSFLSMGGLPPLLGFVMKWIILESLVYMDILVGVVMIISSLVMLYIYMRVVYSSMLGYVSKEVESTNDEFGGYMKLLVVFGTFFLPLGSVFIMD